MPARIIYEGDETAARRHLTVGQNLLHKVRTVAAASGAGVMGQSLSPDPDSFIYVLKVGDTEVIHIFSAPQGAPLIPPVPFVDAPDFLSGVTRNGEIKKRTIVVDGRNVEVKELDSFKPTLEVADAYGLARGNWYRSPRLAVKPWAAFIDGTHSDNAAQYQYVVPSMYTGRMRALAQVILGFGLLPPSQISEKGPDRALMVAEGIQLRFDYRFHRTHNLYRAADGVQWLVEVSQNNGVIAMPLPLYPKDTKLPSGRPSIGECLKEFGGLPTGVAFPAGARLTAALERGDVIRLATASALAPFYALQPYSSAMGWSFNTRGDEAHNTGFYWHPDGLKRGAHYMLQIQIGTSNNFREKNQPIAVGSAFLQKISEDVVYHPSRRQPPPIKFHEPLLPGLLSVEMAADRPVPTTDELPGMDTTMHVMHVDGELCRVNYFWSRIAGSGIEASSNNFESCMLQGKWEGVVRTGYAGWPPCFYTTLEDDRTDYYSSEVLTEISGQSLGFTGYNASDDLEDIRRCFVWRYKRFRTITNVTTTNGNRWGNAVVIPGGTRDCYAYYMTEGKGGGSKRTSVAYPAILDPNQYEAFRYFFNRPPPGAGCYTQAVRKIRAYTPKSYGPSGFGDTGPSECTELADEGEWLDLCFVVDPQLSDVPRDNSYSYGQGIAAKYTARSMLYTDTELGGIKLLSDPDRWVVWQVRSPDPDFGFVQFMSCAHSAFGEQHIAYSEDINGKQLRMGPLIVDEPPISYPNFIGYL